MKPIYLFALLFPLLGFNHSAPTRPGKDYAVFFYVTDYDDRRWPSLPNTKTESESLADELDLQYGFTCEFVRNPTREQIREKIRTYNDRVYAPGDQVLFFFSMHGHYDAELDRGFLIARDGKIGDRYGDSWYSYDDLGTDLSRSKCSHILLALDACHSGAFGIPNEKGDPGGPDFKDEPDCNKKITGFLQHKTRLYLCSGSKEAKTPGESLFAARWMDALRKGGDDGLMTFNDLQFHLGKILKPKYDWGRFKGHDGGDFVFVRKNGCGSTPSSDRDGDGVRNDLDQCPDVYGTAANKGCPDNDGGNNNLADNDLDGVPNNDDACPDQYGTTKARGCPDQDDDGVPDRSDACPNQAGKANWQGCPDSDGDGLPDNTDQCPNQKGAAADKGCPPADRDADGVPDKVDKCPDNAGKANREGCPDPEEDKNNDGLVLVKGGTFTMGSPSNEADRGSNETQHSVTLSDFYIGQYEVTQQLWTQVMGSNPSSFKNCDQCPVEQVSWEDVQTFLKKLNATLPSGQKPYRLPTEAEWEYAARGGGKAILFGNGKNIIDPAEINFGGSAAYKKSYCVAGEYRQKTVPVGSLKSPNALGLHDMSGNVWEWCSDWYGTYASGSQTNPTGPATGSDRVLRGGSWLNYPQYCRVAYRRYDAPGDRNYDIGFRLARTK